MKIYNLSYTEGRNLILPEDTASLNENKAAQQDKLKLLAHYAKLYESLPVEGLELSHFDALPHADETEFQEEGAVELDETENTRGRAVAIGAFDALHLGHQELLNTMLYNAKLHDMIPCVYSFDNLRKAPDGKHIMTKRQRLDFLAAMGVEEYYSQHFNDEFCNLEPAVFLDEILLNDLQVAEIVVGENFRFGQGASGDVRLLEDLCAERGIRLTVVAPVYYDGQIISTTEIRNLLLSGEVELANKLMGHPFAVSGVVHAGKGLARNFRFPTANISWNDEQIRLPFGVYAVRAEIDGVRYSAITNFGVRPTVIQEETEPEVETSLLEVDMDLYEKEMTVEFLKFQRPERKYPSFLILTTAIQKDVAAAREYLKTKEELYCYYDDGTNEIYHLPTERFSCNCMSLLLALPLNKENATKMTLLGNILTACSARYPSRQDFSRHLDALYGMHFNSSTCSLGNVEILQLDMTCIKLAPNGAYNFRDAFHFVFDSLTNPFLDKDNVFNRAVFEQEKHSLLLDLRTKIDDRDNYAVKQAIDILYEGSDYVVDPGGEIDVLEALTAEDITAFWRQLLSEAHIMTFIGGSMSSKSLVQLKERIQALPRHGQRFKLLKNRMPSPYRLTKDIAEQRRSNFLRSRYLLFFSNLPNYSARKTLTLQLLLAILAGDSQSLLFKKIREQLGLVYGINYDLLNYMDCLVLLFSLREENVGLLKSNIAELWQQLTHEGIDDTVFANAKLLLRNQLLNMADAVVDVLTYYINNVIAGLNLNIDTSLDCLQSISKAEVEALAGELKARGFFHIIGEGQEEHDE